MLAVNHQQASLSAESSILQVPNSERCRSKSGKGGGDDAEEEEEE